MAAAPARMAARRLVSCAWKPLVIDEVLRQDEGRVLWLDCATLFHGSLGRTLTRPRERGAQRGRSSSFWTRQLFMSATYSTFSDGQARLWIQLNWPMSWPDSPSIPTIFPSSVSL